MKTFKQFNEKAPNTADAMKRYKAGKAGFTDIAHLKAKGLIARSDGEKKKSDKSDRPCTFSAPRPSVRGGSAQQSSTGCRWA